MYSLRRFASYGKGVEINQWLGKNYTKIHKNSDTEEFEKSFTNFFGRERLPDNEKDADHDSINVFCFIYYEGGECQPLYKNQNNYIVTESGKTYDTLRVYGE